MTAFLGSLLLWGDEAVLFLGTCWGLLLVLKWLVARRRVFPGVSDRGLVRFAVFEVWFVGCWSALFKDLLPDWQRQPSTSALYHGWSQSFASLAEDAGVALTAFVFWWLLERGFWRVRDVGPWGLLNRGMDRPECSSAEDRQRVASQ